MDLISRTDLMNDLNTSVVFSGRTHDPGEHNSEVVGAQKVINRIETAPEVKAIPIEWLRQWEQKYNEQVDEPWFKGSTVISEVIKDWEKENGTD